MDIDDFDFSLPGDEDMIIRTELQNPYNNKTLTIISGEFKELNGKKMRPNTNLEVSFIVPAGYREYIKSTSFKGNPFIYVGLRDKEAAEPVVYKPTI